MLKGFPDDSRYREGDERIEEKLNGILKSVSKDYAAGKQR